MLKLNNLLNINKYNYRNCVNNKPNYSVFFSFLATIELVTRLSLVVHKNKENKSYHKYFAAYIECIINFIAKMDIHNILPGILSVLVKNSKKFLDNAYSCKYKTKILQAMHRVLFLLMFIIYHQQAGTVELQRKGLSLVHRPVI